MTKADWQLVFKSRYKDACLVKTEFNLATNEICLSIRSTEAMIPTEYTFTPDVAIEIAYAILRAQQYLHTGLEREED